ncbi:MAG: FAD-dependent oxidoreductase [Planctomycetota bacterium]
MKANPLPALSLCLAATAAQAGSVLVEAEGFENLGGWVIDQQFMDQMGSPFLLAHGLGKPVADAVTAVQFPAPGNYRVWVRTRDWVAPWKAPGAPGRFQVLVDGKVLEKEFGAEGADWHWQDGGTVQIAGKQAALALHDLTGFEGRCDAIFFTSDPGLTPPNAGEELAAFRRKMLSLPEQPEEGGAFDLVVAGGGIAGTCAALSAARLGLTVALVQDRPVLGGNNSSEVRVWLGGDICKQPYPRIGDVVKELDQKVRAHYGPTNTAEIYEDDKKLALVRAEKNITLFLDQRVNQVEAEGQRLKAVVAQALVSGRRVRLAGRWFADCTGDGTVGFLAGAHFEMAEKERMGACNLWNVRDTGAVVTFPRCPWALDMSGKPFPGRKENDIHALGGWYWESGFAHNPFEKGEYIRDWNLRAMYGAWDCLKNVDGKFPNYKLNWCAHIMGARESRRLLGDMCLTKDDLVHGTAYPDGCVPTSWDMDLHLPDKRYEKGFEGEAFISKDYHTAYPRPYWIPYRCLYSRNVTNLFMAGRDISVTHEALGSVRVMRTGGMMGEVVGMAAAVCKKNRTEPRGVYAEHLDELKELMARGVGK